MTGVYRQNPAVVWRYREPNRFVALHSLFVAPTNQEDPTPFLVKRNARHPWLYSPDPDIDWHYYGRNFMVPLGVPQVTAIEAPAGQLMMLGRSPSTSTGQIEGLVQVPLEYPSSGQYGGVYRPRSQAMRRFVTIAEGSPAELINIVATVDTEESSGTSHTVNIPDGSNVIGRRVIVWASSDDTPTYTWPAGWTELFEDAGTNVAHGIAYRDIDGTEDFTGTGDTITVTTSTSQPSAFHAKLIASFSGAPEVSAGATSSSATPDPDSLSVSDSSATYLFVAAMSSDTGATSVSAYPSGYGNGTDPKSASTFGCRLGVADRIGTASGGAEDPGTFTITQSRNWVATTVAIKSQDLSSDVIINVPAGEAVFAGQTANLGDTIITVPLGAFSMAGELPTLATGGTEGVSALFPAQRTTATFQEDHAERVFLPEDTDVREL